MAAGMKAMLLLCRPMEIVWSKHSNWNTFFLYGSYFDKIKRLNHLSKVLLQYYFVIYELFAMNLSRISISG